MGVALTAFDRAAFALAASVSAGRLAAYRLAEKVPGLRALADRRLVAIIRKQLAGYGRAHFTTDASAYRPAVPVART